MQHMGTSGLAVPPALQVLPLPGSADMQTLPSPQRALGEVGCPAPLLAWDCCTGRSGLRQAPLCCTQCHGGDPGRERCNVRGNMGQARALWTHSSAQSVPSSPGYFRPDLPSPIVHLRATQSLQLPQSSQPRAHLIPVPLNPAFSFPPVHPSSLKPSFSVAASLPSQLHSVPQSSPAAPPSPPAQLCPHTGEPCPCPSRAGKRCFPVVPPTWDGPEGAEGGSSEDLVPADDSVEPWESSLLACSGDSPSLLLSSSKANASDGLEKFTCVPARQREVDIRDVLAALPAAAMAACLLLPASCVGTTVVHLLVGGMG